MIRSARTWNNVMEERMCESVNAPMTVPLMKVARQPRKVNPMGSQMAYRRCFLLLREKMRRPHRPHRPKASPVSRRHQ